MRREVTREEFLIHLQALINEETDVPCTVETPFPIIDITAGGQAAGTASISYFPEWTPDWLLRDHPEMERTRGIMCNHTGAGMRYTVMSSQFQGYEKQVRIIEEEEELATRRGVTLTYTIGQKMDRYGMGKRGDPPGVDFDMYKGRN